VGKTGIIAELNQEFYQHWLRNRQMVLAAFAVLANKDESLTSSLFRSKVVTSIPCRSNIRRPLRTAASSPLGALVL